MEQLQRNPECSKTIAEKSACLGKIEIGLLIQMKTICNIRIYNKLIVLALYTNLLDPEEWTRPKSIIIIVSTF
jgi:hypothetical protein